MFEMVVNLYYINDDKSEREERLKRFFYYDVVLQYNTLEIYRHIPEMSRDFGFEKHDSRIQSEYNQYKSRYKIKNNVPNWSGYNLLDMINKISDEGKRNDLFNGFYLLTKNNNMYVHPSIKYIKNIIDEEYGDGFKHKDAMLLSLLESVFVSVIHIKDIYLEHFQKNRQYFRNKCNELKTRHEKIRSQLNTESFKSHSSN